MAITDYKITDGEITQRNVKSAPDVLSDTPNNNKAVFDNLTEHFIGKYNDLIDNINSDFVDSSEFAEGLTVTDKVRWRYALTKGTSIGLNFSGNITQITTGFRTIVGDIDNLTETDFMDCYLSINGTDYECGDSYASGSSIFTSAVINGVTVDIIYDTTNGNITLEHATNPLDTLYWNVSIYRSVAEKVPRKALPASVSNDGYTELNDKIDDGYTELSGDISTINNTLTPLVKLQYESINLQTIGTSQTKSGTHTPTHPSSYSGYRPIGIVGYELDHTGGLLKIERLEITKEDETYKVGYKVVNTSTSTNSESTALYVRILYVREEVV